MTNSSVTPQPALDNSTVTYRKVNGVDILPDVYRPVGNALRPLIVDIHGGALINGIGY